MEQNSLRIGRPPKAEPEALRSQLLGLIEQLGYERASMGSLAADVGMNVRTLHRYFPAKADIVWGGIESSIEILVSELNSADEARSTLDAVADAIAGVFDQNADDLAIMRTRLRLIALTPELQASRSATFEGWRQAIIRFVAFRLELAPNSLICVTAGTAMHAAIMEALSWWALHAEVADPAGCITEALHSLSALGEP
ncbi:acyl-CoA-like ligand-binding transcription factor [Microterricola viridarii]|jgi:AcrR family transcriptional regulator|uniref:DNA-binding transcriptional regulator, AcrR family n=1 Tax=Microterricola viridarii TaxID=412690 RepID=A0A1H1VEZ1_9MICO|nr:TetR family transcriptional regulator [Microterricola viridarii]SDS82749.1 DNA-binding transcriptional regulator, AcrR family [Microterricola viridarii]